MNENPGLAPDAATERDLIRRKQLGRLGTRRRHKVSQHDRDAELATRPLASFRATSPRT